ncbi:MAG: hypothetical protein ABEJ58_10370 [Halodesulfurarchaeum sp.]
MVETVLERNGIRSRYLETDGERVLHLVRGEQEAVLAQNLTGYAMVTVRSGPEGEELERYYGFEMALDHAAEVLGVSAGAIPVPEEAADMGM